MEGIIVNGDMRIEKAPAYTHTFSVVMAVYNVAPYLHEAIESILGQDIGFEEHIQLILVDDGSTDGSSDICDDYGTSYPDNIVVVHQCNEGVASARNHGLRYATGRYINFADSDDKFSLDAFRKVESFFSCHEDETDIVTIPIYFFDAAQGGHWQNNKFNKGNRVIDLNVGYRASLMFVNASFFGAWLKDDMVFDPRLECGEDIKMIMPIILRKMTLGVVSNCKYFYRRRESNDSLINLKETKKSWYFNYFTDLVDWSVQYAIDVFGYIPAYVQYLLTCDLQWRFRNEYDMKAVLSDEEIEKYKELLFKSLRYFDDHYLMELNQFIFREHKWYMLSKKYQAPPLISFGKEHALVHFENTIIGDMVDDYTMIEFLNIKGDILHIEGYTMVMACTEDEPITLSWRDEFSEEKVSYDCTIINRSSLNQYRFDEIIFRCIGFSADIQLDDSMEWHSFKLIMHFRNHDIVKKGYRIGKYVPITRNFSKSYYYSKNKGWKYTYSGNAILISRCGFKGAIKSEFDYLRQLCHSNREGAHKAVFARMAAHFFGYLKRKPIWLISDRVNKADDNGEAFFEYVQGRRDCRANCFFVLSRQSPDYKRIKSIGKVIDPSSFMYKILFLLADLIISSQADEINVLPFQNYSDCYSDILSRHKFIFLQHGVTKDDLSKWLNKGNKNIACFACVSPMEQQSILANNAYNYTENEVKLTGFARYDKLYNDTKKYITFMPTWRAYLVSRMDMQSGRRSVLPGFKSSMYYAMYHDVLTDVRLRTAAEFYGYELRFMTHPNMSEAVSELGLPDNIQILSMDESYRKIFAESSLIVTDYSSVAFDFAYLYKPVIYYQADVEEFFSGNHTYDKGYFDYEENGFGEVERNSDDLIDRLIEYMERGCQLKECYRARIDSFFAFHDKNNAERIYDCVQNL